MISTTDTTTGAARTRRPGPRTARREVRNRFGTPVPVRRRTGRAGARRELVWGIVFLAPAVIALAVLRVAPTIDAVGSSLLKAFPGGLIPPTFTGFGNYESLFGDPAFLATVGRTLLFNVVINPLQIVVALLVAVLLTQRIPLVGLWRTLLVVPVTIPIVGSCIAWGAAFNPQGPINAAITAIGGGTQPFLTSPRQALACIIIVASWIGIGYWMMFLVSGIQAIPGELYEAAKLDRAGPVRTFLRITLPMLRRQLLFVLVADTVANFVLFVPVQLLTNGGPQDSTTLLMFDAYRTTYGYGSQNLGSAEVIVLTVIMLVFVVLQFRLLREDGEDA
ncbi:carbohydrate ABC transporter permease [Curtobacterium sp. MCBD17_019]|uniref:carbohydrate ABC transporter permease n=1 Tax=Curtobacterium sp. MCBD17_019 TaxID=2175669 RepID=UPI0021ABE533|nr:sugar ABC transporter permease [Curtobacterium sp. MCBD17_019]